MRKYAIIGTGAIGGYCAVKLQQAGFEVHCLLRSDYTHVKEQGLTLIENNEVVTVPVAAYENAKNMPPCDVILVTLKTTAYSVLKDILPKLIQPHTVVVLLQNGIGMEKEIADYIAADNIIGSSCILKVTKHSLGQITHYSHNIIEFAQYYADEARVGINKNVEQLREDFNKAGFKASAEEHLPTIRWRKLAANIPINGLSVVLQASSREMVENAASYELLCALTKEVVDAALKCKAKIPEDFYQFRLTMLLRFKLFPKSYSSMKTDFDAKQPLELQAVYENALQIAQQHHAEMPLTKMLYQQLVYLDAKNRIF